LQFSGGIGARRRVFTASKRRAIVVREFIESMGDVSASIRRGPGIVSGDRLNVSVATLLQAPLPMAADFFPLVTYFAVMPVGSR
jgi:hypothetical protein